MGRALAAFVLGVFLALAAIGFAMYYGFLPRVVQEVSFSTGGSTSTTTTVASGDGYSGASSTSATISSGNSSDVIGSSSGNSSDVIGSALGQIGSYIVRSKDTVVGFFNWLLGSSLADAITNLIVLVIIAGIVYWFTKFFKWIVTIVVMIDAVLIVLKYVLMVI